MRKRLSKLLGKRVAYTATVNTIRGCNVCLVNVCHKGKEVADHLWCSCKFIIENYEKGTEIDFTAVAYTYRDTKNIRKNGIKNLLGFKESDKEYEDVVTKEHKNLRKRNYKK